MGEESEYLMNNMKVFTSKSNDYVKWDRLEKEIEYLSNSLTFEHVFKLFEENFLSDQVKPVVFRVFSQKFKDEAKYFDHETASTGKSDCFDG